MAFTPVIRLANEADAPTLLEIYRPYVQETVVSFETEVPSIEEFARRIRIAIAGWCWLVAEFDGKCVGYAYSSSHRDRAAYRWSVETSAYVDASYRRRGIARALYGQLLEKLAQKGFCNAYAGMTLPNAASSALHRSVGFEPIGVFRSVGWKFGAWHDVAWFHRRLRDYPPADG
jgi:L-amino acid N-acyltransferase YncA